MTQIATYAAILNRKERKDRKEADVASERRFRFLTAERQVIGIACRQ
jgi:hypothetical protein